MPSSHMGKIQGTACSEIAALSIRQIADNPFLAGKQASWRCRCLGDVADCSARVSALRVREMRSNTHPDMGRWTRCHRVALRSNTMQRSRADAMDLGGQQAHTTHEAARLRAERATLTYQTPKTTRKPSNADRITLSTSHSLRCCVRDPMQSSLCSLLLLLTAIA